MERSEMVALIRAGVPGSGGVWADLGAGTGNFTWSDTDANYIGLDGRDGTSVTLDNLSIETIPEPTAAALGLLGVVALLRRRR